MDVDKGIAGAPGNLGRLLELLDRTGLRLNEAATLEWSQFDAQRREILLPRTKTNRPRVISLTDDLMSPAVGTIVGTSRRRCDVRGYSDMATGSHTVERQTRSTSRSSV